MIELTVIVNAKDQFGVVIFLLNIFFFCGMRVAIILCTALEVIYPLVNGQGRVAAVMYGMKGCLLSVVIFEYHKSSEMIANYMQPVMPYVGAGVCDTSLVYEPIWGYGNKYTALNQ
jgi:hypothetical protein